MKLSTWAKIQGVHYRTAWQWFEDGNLPVKAYQTQTGTVIVEEATDNRVVVKIAAYARVSSSDQKADLERHLDRIMQFGNACGHQIKVAFTEVGSGLNGRRSKLLQLLGDATRTPRPACAVWL